MKPKSVVMRDGGVVRVSIDAYDDLRRVLVDAGPSPNVLCLRPIEAERLAKAIARAATAARKARL